MIAEMQRSGKVFPVLAINHRSLGVNSFYIKENTAHRWCTKERPGLQIPDKQNAAQRTLVVFNANKKKCEVMADVVKVECGDFDLYITACRGASIRLGPIKEAKVSDAASFVSVFTLHPTCGYTVLATKPGLDVFPCWEPASRVSVHRKLKGAQ
jgi:hypothetical protein